MTGTKNKLRLTEKNSRPNRRTFCRKKAWHHELEKKDYAIMWTIKDYGYAVTSEMCLLRALGITDFNATLRL